MTPKLIAENDQVHLVGADMSGTAHTGAVSSGPFTMSIWLELSTLPKIHPRAHQQQRAPKPRDLGGGA
jgi:hypothetical protein